MKNLKLYEDFLNESELTPRDEMIKLLAAKFPNMKTRPAEDFKNDEGSERGIWTGAEGTTFVDANKKIPAFNPTGAYGYNPRMNKHYVDEVHERLYKFLKEHGYYAEFYDEGTVFFWPIN